jgi:hypothetical protein
MASTSPDFRSDLKIGTKGEVQHGASPLSGGTFGVPDSDGPLRRQLVSNALNSIGSDEKSSPVTRYCALPAKTNVRSLNAISVRTLLSPWCDVFTATIAFFLSTIFAGAVTVVLP